MNYFFLTRILFCFLLQFSHWRTEKKTEGEKKHKKERKSQKEKAKKTKKKMKERKKSLV